MGNINHYTCPFGWTSLYHSLSSNHHICFLLQCKPIFKRFHQTTNLEAMQSVLPFLYNIFLHIMSFSSMQNIILIFIVYLCMSMTLTPHTLNGTIKSKSHVILQNSQSCHIEVATHLSSCHNMITFGELSCTISKL